MIGPMEVFINIGMLERSWLEEGGKSNLQKNDWRCGSFQKG